MNDNELKRNICTQEVVFDGDIDKFKQSIKNAMMKEYEENKCLLENNIDYEYFFPIIFTITNGSGSLSVNLEDFVSYPDDQVYNVFNYHFTNNKELINYKQPIISMGKTLKICTLKSTDEEMYMIKDFNNGKKITNKIIQLNKNDINYILN